MNKIGIYLFAVAALFVLMSGAWAAPDTTAPVTTFSSYQDTNITDQNIILHCTDDNTGCKMMHYSIDGGVWIDLVPKRVDVNNITNGTTYNQTHNYYEEFASYNIYSPWGLAFTTNATISLNPYDTSRAYSYLKYTYSDGSTDDSDTQTADGSENTWFDRTFTVDSNASKYLTNIKLMLKIDSSGHMWSRDLIIDYNNGWGDFNGEYSIIYSGAGDHNIRYFSTDYADNNEVMHTSYFTTYGVGHFVFKNELTGAALPGVITSFNDINYPGTDINFFGVTSGNYIFRFYKSGYSMRQWQMDVNHYTDFNKTILLLPDENTAVIAFRFFKPDKVTPMANSYIDVNNTTGNGWTERLKTDSQGNVTFTVNAAAGNYFFNIVSDTNVSYIYTNVSLTINRPRDEITNALITGNWSYEISGGLVSVLDTNVTTDTKVMLIYGNTILDYRIVIDINNIANYDARTYYVRVLGSDTTYSLQPYLVAYANSALIKFIAIDKSINAPVEGVELGFYKVILGSTVKVANGVTDVTGSSIVSLVVGYTYRITLARGGVEFFSSDNFVVGSSPVYIYLSGSNVSILYIDTNAPKIIWNPATDYLPLGTVGISQTISGTNISWVSVHIYQYNDFNMMTGATLLHDVNTPCTPSAGCSISTLLAIIPYDTNMPFYVDVNVYTDSNTSVLHGNHKYFGAPTHGIDLISSFRNVKKDFGCSTAPFMTNPLAPCGIGIIISIIATLLIVVFLVFKFGITSPIPLTIVGLFLLGFFTFIEWMYLPIFALFALGGLFAIFRSITSAG